MIAGKKYAAKRFPVQAGHHTQGIAGPAPENAGLTGEGGGVQVAGGVMGVLHQQAIRPTGQGALTGGGHLGGHLFAEGLIIESGTPLGLLPVGNTAGSFDVGAEIKLHRTGLPSVFFSIP